jgi:DNA polymerase-4/DNA polymerase V
MTHSKGWPQAIAHIDADAFYASCEAVRHPELKGRPLCVLSSQDAFVVAKCYRAKALGIKTAMFVSEARRLAPDAVFLPPDFRFYGQLSGKLFAILNRYSPEVEQYSIDEGFIDLGGMAELWQGNWRALADAIREAVWREVGISVSVGIASTKLLAKLASESNKPDGSTVIPPARSARFLSSIPVAEIPGVGRNRAVLLQQHGIATAGLFAASDVAVIDRLLGRHGRVMHAELNGRIAWPLQAEAPLPGSVSRTASMGQMSGDERRIAAHLSHHTMRLVSELVARRLLAGRLQVFLTLKSFEQAKLSLPLPHPSDSLRRISHTVQQAFRQLYRQGEVYRACGVTASGITLREGAVQQSLFGSVHREDERQQGLMQAVNAINRRFGNHSITTASEGQLVRKGNPEVRFRYPVFVAK